MVIWTNLARFEQQNGHLAEVKVDEVPGFMGDITAEVSADDAVPCGRVFLVEFLLDVRGNILRSWEYHRERKLISVSHSTQWMNSLVELFVGNRLVHRLCSFTSRKQGILGILVESGLAQGVLTFSILYFSIAWVAVSTASCCISSDMSAFLMTAFLSLLILVCLC